MESALYLAAVLTVVTGIAHSVLGERLLLAKLLRRDDLPALSGSRRATARVLRLAWHVTLARLVRSGGGARPAGPTSAVRAGDRAGDRRDFPRSLRDRAHRLARPASLVAAVLAIGVLAIWATRGA
jgi:hypothetical protein